MFELAYYHCHDSSLITIATNVRASLQSNHLNVDSWAVRRRNDVFSSWPRGKQLPLDFENRDRTRVALGSVNLVCESDVVVLHTEHLLDAVDYDG